MHLEKVDTPTDLDVITRKNMKKHSVIIHTNSYTGNFEREMCAYVTGHFGDCEVGSEQVEDGIQEKFEGYIRNEHDEHGCSRPVIISNYGTGSHHSLEIFLCSKLPKKLHGLLVSRATEYAAANDLKIKEVILREATIVIDNKDTKLEIK